MPATTPPAPVLPPIPPGRRVLVVEDDEAVRGTLLLLLAHYEFVAHSAPTLAAARRLLATTDPDAVVLDLHLPDGHGVDLLEHVRSTAGRPRVLVLSGGTAPEHLARLRVLRPDRVYRKPMNFLDLLDGLRAEPADAAHGVAGRAVATEA